MSEDIKEMFDIKELFEEWKQFLRWCYKNNDKTVEIHRDKLKWTMDYITNLQEENEHTNYCNEQLRKKITNLEYKINTFEDYKSRNEKTTNKIELLLKDLKDMQKLEKETGKEHFTLELFAIRIKEIYKLLQGSDKE